MHWHANRLYTDEQKKIRNRYWEAKHSAKTRGIQFLLTFDEWWNIWNESGKYNQRGCKKGQYVMSRKGPDIGPYEIGNVFIQTNSANVSEARIAGTPWNKGLKFKKEEE